MQLHDIADTERMNILRMVLGVKTTIALVCDLEQHCCNMDRAHESTFTNLGSTSNSSFFILICFFYQLLLEYQDFMFSM